MLRSGIILLNLTGLILCLAPPAHAQVLRLTDENTAGKVQPTSAEKKLPKEFRFEPAAELSPAFRYQFWVPPIRREPGNAVSHLLRAYVMMQDVPNLEQIQREWGERESHFDEDLPLKGFPLEEARAYLANFRNVLDELAHAERSERIDYDFRISELKGTQVFATLLPELQHARNLGRLLALDARLAIAERRYEDAIRSLRTGFRLGEIVSSMGKSFLVGKLVALAIDGLMLAEVETLMQQPGAPNLYWALASLPEEIGEMRDALEGERLGLENTLYRVMRLPSEPMSAAAWQDRILTTVADFFQLQGGGALADDADHSQARLISGIILLAHGDLAKESLVGKGFSQESLEAMSYAEAVVRATRDAVLVMQSQFYKWSLVPRSEADINKLAEDYLKDQISRKQMDPATVIGGLLLPAIQAAQAAGDRALTKRNQLITLEAIRAYTAAHDGRLPDSLEKLEPLPTWKQAGTGKPFEYERISDSEAMLRRAPYWPGGHDRDAEIHLIVRPSEKR